VDVPVACVEPATCTATPVCRSRYHCNVGGAATETTSTARCRGDTMVLRDISDGCSDAIGHLSQATIRPRFHTSVCVCVCIAGIREGLLPRLPVLLVLGKVCCPDGQQHYAACLTRTGVSMEPSSPLPFQLSQQPPLAPHYNTATPPLPHRH